MPQQQPPPPPGGPPLLQRQATSTSLVLASVSDDQEAAGQLFLLGNRDNSVNMGRGMSPNSTARAIAALPPDDLSAEINPRHLMSPPQLPPPRPPPPPGGSVSRADFRLAPRTTDARLTDMVAELDLVVGEAQHNLFQATLRPDSPAVSDGSPNSGGRGRGRFDLSHLSLSPPRVVVRASVARGGGL